jgi:hypothetical protein
MISFVIRDDFTINQLNNIRATPTATEPIDPILNPHGQSWKDDGEILIDPASNECYTSSMRLDWHGLFHCNEANVNFYDYFLFPMRFIQSECIPHTN